MDKINKNANISSIEDFLYTEFFGISEKLVIGFFPEVLEEGTDDTILIIDLANGINLKTTPIKVNAYIWLCAKNEGGTKNSNALKLMEESLNEIISEFQDENNEYMLSKIRSNPSKVDDTDYFSNVITVQVTVL